MEIEITRIVNEEDPCQFSDSIANSGMDNIGSITWRNACRYFEDHDLLVGSDGQEDLRSWIQDFGAWDTNEISEMSDLETNALLLQFVASEISEYQRAEDRGDLERWEENFGGRIYKGDNGSWYFYVGC